MLLVMIFTAFTKSGVGIGVALNSLADVVILAVLGLHDLDLLCVCQAKGELITVNAKLHRVSKRGIFYNLDPGSRDNTHIKKMLAKSSLPANFCYYCTFIYLNIF